MAFVVLGFPSISESNFNWIQSYREENDKLFCNVVNPHFTFVFPINDTNEKQFVDEIHLQTENCSIIDFEISKAIITKDALSDYYHEFLIPDKGYTKIVELHDKLYANKLVKYLRHDIDYIPHIGIGKSKDPNTSTERIKSLRIPIINGKIEELTIAKYENNTVSQIASIRLS